MNVFSRRLKQLRAEKGVSRAKMSDDCKTVIATIKPLFSQTRAAKIKKAKNQHNEEIKNSFISSVSHELRTPLTAIRGWGETAKMSIEVDDKELVEKSGEIAKTSAPIYETDLMENSGSIKGYAIKDGAALDSVKAALEKLYAKNTSADGSVFMFAVGDGNHSLATAKAVWDELKEKNGGVKNEDGTVLLKFKSNQSQMIYTWLLSFGNNATVIKPQELREKNCSECKKVVEKCLHE